MPVGMDVVKEIGDQMPDRPVRIFRVRSFQQARQTDIMEQLVKASGAAKPKKRTAPKRLPAELDELQEKIRRRTGLKSTLTGSVSKGRIVLQYSSREELERLNEILDRIGE